MSIKKSQWRQWVAFSVDAINDILSMLRDFGLPVPAIVDDIMFMLSSIITADDLDPVSPDINEPVN